jgi:hypothetical protein
MVKRRTLSFGHMDYKQLMESGDLEYYYIIILISGYKKLFIETLFSDG